MICCFKYSKCFTDSISSSSSSLDISLPSQVSLSANSFGINWSKSDCDWPTDVVSVMNNRARCKHTILSNKLLVEDWLVVNSVDFRVVVLAIALENILIWFCIWKAYIIIVLVLASLLTWERVKYWLGTNRFDPSGLRAVRIERMYSSTGIFRPWMNSVG